MRGISSLLDADMEDSTQFVDENLIISTASESELPKKKIARPKNADNPTSKPKAAPRKPKAAKEEGAKKATGKATGTKRKALEEQVGGVTERATKKSFTAAAAQSEDELEGVRVGDESKQDTNPKPKRRAKASKKVVEDGDESGHNPTVAQEISTHREGMKAKIAQKAITNKSQPPNRELDSNAESNSICSPRRPAQKPVQSASQSRQETGFRRAAGSASDTERGGDPNLRRKLGDITRKFENIDLKYRNLKDVGISEANANIEKLRKQCEATTTASAELISSLKKELAMQMPLAQEARQLQTDLQISSNDANKYRSAISELEASLATAQNENRALQAKLAAARSSVTSVENTTAKTPGSAKKNIGQARTVMLGSAEAIQAAQSAQLKEDLYSDLTGLIIRSVKRTDEGDVYDCIQTGRNGSKSPRCCSISTGC
jgi:chromosome segregation ATPase